MNPKIRAVQLSMEGLLKLLGGSADDRLKYWETLKGITSRAEFALISHQLEIMNNSVKQIQTSAKTLQKVASQIQANG